MQTKCPYCGYEVRQNQDKLVCVRNKHHFAFISNGKFQDTSQWIVQSATTQQSPFIR
jgi:hypothetical protein